MANNLIEMDVGRTTDCDKGMYESFQTGFHGDLYLMKLADVLLKRSKYFIETGTYAGDTVSYVARSYPNIQCLSCEPDETRFNHAIENTKNVSNVTLFNLTSQEFTKYIYRNNDYLFTEKVLFWLDAHDYGFEWPLRQEISFITTHFEQAYILIDDFKVPGFSCFGYDQWNGQVCEYEYVQSALNSHLEYVIYYPRYTEITSTYHPLRGWGLIDYGHDEVLKFPRELSEKVQWARFKPSHHAIILRVRLFIHRLFMDG